jgi:hypothetical protein
MRRDIFLAIILLTVPSPIPYSSASSLWLFPADPQSVQPSSVDPILVTSFSEDCIDYVVDSHVYAASLVLPKKTSARLLDEN